MFTPEQLQNLAHKCGASINSSSIMMPPTREQAKNDRPGDVITITSIDEAYKKLLNWSELCSLRHEIKKSEIEQFVRNKLATSDAWAKKALTTIMARQTVEERRAERTVYHNNVGFTGHDSPLMSSFAKQLETRKWLSKRQIQVLKKTIKKYWKQIVDASDELALLRMIKNTRDAQQMSLNLE